MAAEPAAKKAKVEVEVPQEHETDAKAVKSGLSDHIDFHAKDTTLNFMNMPVGAGSCVLKSLSDGGFAHLLAGARANVGVKAGRHMFEVKVVEQVSQEDSRGNAPKGPRHVLKIGFSTQNSSLFLGESDESLCFEMDGSFVIDKKRQSTGKGRWGREAILAVVLNLDKKSQNANTVSLFADGVRLCQPVALPEALKGKTLYPAFTFRNVTAHVNFGPEPLSAMPFKCHMILGSEKAEAEVAPVPAAPKDGKYEVLYPVGLPDEGPFDWLDMFLAQNPKYTEVSERSLLAWAEKSGVSRSGKVVAKDNSETNLVDEIGCRHLLQNLSTLQKRDFIVMGLKSNLTKEGRANALTFFPNSSFKKVATVVMGEPTTDFCKYVKTLTLKDKQAASDVQFRAKQAEEKRQRMAAKQKKKAEKAKAKAEKLRLKKAEEQKKKLEDAKKKAAGEEVPEEEEKKEEEPEEPESEEEAEPAPEDPPKAELTEDEKKLKFHKSLVPDMSSFNLATTFTKFSVPAKDEGFDEVRYAWSKGPQCEEHLKKWMQSKKLTTRVEDITPSAWFQGKWSSWSKVLQQWNSKQGGYRAMLSKRESDKKAKALKKAAAAQKFEADKKKFEAAKAKAEADEKEFTETEPAPPKEEAEEMDQDHEDEKVDFDGLDVFGVEDVCDLGGGLPLFKSFQAEDWAMLALRFELYVLVHAFKKDSTDPDRSLVHVDHLGFYFQKYFKKSLTPKSYGVETMKELVGLVTDTVFLSEEGVLRTLVPDELEAPAVFVKITEEERRHRTLKVEAGDESARLKVSTHQNSQSGGGGGGGHQKGGGGKQQDGKWGASGGNWGVDWNAAVGAGNWGSGGAGKKNWGGKKW